MKRLVFYLFSVIGLLLEQGQATLSAQVWQWSVPVKNYSAKPKSTKCTAFLWIPERCKQVKAVIVAQSNMEEISILEDAGFRRKMSQLDVAQVWVTPMFDNLFNFNDGAWETLQGILTALADESGYKEIATASLIGMGHSAAASFPYYLGAFQPQRTIACISTSGQWPYFRHPSFAPDIWGERTIDYIPSLETMGEYESAHSWSNEGLKERYDHPLMPLSMLACPAEGHFASSPEKAQYIGLYIQKAMLYGHVDPTKTGWLMERWKKDQLPGCEPAPVGEYKGDPKEAFWFFDKEMIQATVAYQSRFRNLKPQLLGLLQQGKRVEQRNDHLQLHPRFITEEDGRSIVLSPTFLDTVPAVSSRLTDWTGLPVGTAIGHAQGKIGLEKICGSFEIVDDTVLVETWNRATPTYAEKDAMSFAIKNSGDKRYKPAVQQAEIAFSLYRKEGKAQQIIFQPIADCCLSRLPKSLDLQAASDAGLPVSFYVVAGPCEIEGSKLLFRKIPPRTKFPMKVTVTAWQSGNNSTQTAQPVTKTFYIQK